MRIYASSNRERASVRLTTGTSRLKTKFILNSKILSDLSDKMGPEREDDALSDMTESIDELKERLSSMKRLMEERKARGSNKDLLQGQSRSLKGASIIDGNFLAFVFGTSLLIIVSVSVYAFYQLYHAVLKKFPSTHTEL